MISIPFILGWLGGWYFTEPKVIEIASKESAAKQYIDWIGRIKEDCGDKYKPYEVDGDRLYVGTCTKIIKGNIQVERYSAYAFPAL